MINKIFVFSCNSTTFSQIQKVLRILPQASLLKKEKVREILSKFIEQDSTQQIKINFDKTVILLPELNSYINELSSESTSCIFKEYDENDIAILLGLYVEKYTSLHKAKNILIEDIESSQ